MSLIRACFVGLIVQIAASAPSVAQSIRSRSSGSSGKPPARRASNLARLACDFETEIFTLWHRLLRRSASESGRLCHGNGGHEWGTAAGGR